MQPYNPAVPGYTFSRLLNGRLARKQENAGKPRFWWLMLSYTHLMLLLQPSALWLSIVTFNNDAKPPPK